RGGGERGVQRLVKVLEKRLAPEQRRLGRFAGNPVGQVVGSPPGRGASSQFFARPQALPPDNHAGFADRFPVVSPDRAAYMKEGVIVRVARRRPGYRLVVPMLAAVGRL